MKNNSLILCALLLGSLSGCARREEADVSTDQPQSAPVTVEQAEAEVPAATIAPVNVEVTLTPVASTALSSKGEKVTVTATYSGDPRADEAAQKMADESGMIRLGEAKKTLDGAGKIVFQDDVIDKSRLEQTVGEVQLTINVTSSMTSSSQNLLACPFYWETLANASKQPVQIACKALSEVQE